MWCSVRRSVPGIQCHRIYATGLFVHCSIPGTCACICVQKITAHAPAVLAWVVLEKLEAVSMPRVVSGNRKVVQENKKKKKKGSAVGFEISCCVTVSSERT